MYHEIFFFKYTDCSNSNLVIIINKLKLQLPHANSNFKIFIFIARGRDFTFTYHSGADFAKAAALEMALAAPRELSTGE